MSRQKGTLKLPSNIEPEASAPLDAREVVNTLADLTDSTSFPYPYVGMKVTIKATGDIYVLLDDSDITDITNWKQVGGSGGGAVDSVNGKTGVVVLDAEDVGAQTSEMPTASATYVGKVTQYIGTTTSSYIHGLVYECVEDSSSTPSTYSWVAVETTDISGKVDKVGGKGLSTNDYDNTAKEIVDGVTAQLALKANSADLGTAAAKDSTSSVISGSTNLVESGAVHDAINVAIASIYKPAGDKTVAELTNALLIAANLGNVYNTTDSGTTTADFVEGAGKPIAIGDNIAIVDVGSAGSPSYKFDIFSGFIDLSGYVEKSSTTGFLKNDGSVDEHEYVDVTDTLSEADLDDIVTPIPLNPASTYIPNCGFTPVGTVISVMGVNAPANYLKCDGTVYYISDYPVLAKYFEDEFGTKNHFGGDGTSTFAVPDLQGEFLRGTGTNSHTNQGSGANVGVHQDATQIPTTFTTNASNAITATKIGDYSSLSEYDSEFGTSSGRITVSGSGSATSAGGYHTVRPTNTSVLYCIATKNIYIDAKYNYSTDETVVGQWVDGKPVYQKTVTIDALPNATNTTYDVGLSNIFYCNVVQSYMVFPSGNKVPLPHSDPTNLAAGVGIQLNLDGTITAFAGANRSGCSAVITVQYTKTTD